MVIKYQLVPESGGFEVKVSRSPKTPINPAVILRAYLAGADREQLVEILVDDNFKPIGINTISLGTQESQAFPGEVFKPAILANAAGIILGHNHPSGDPTPSKSDIEATTSIVVAGKLLGIPVLDHIIVGSGGNYYSFYEEGHLDE